MTSDRRHDGRPRGSRGRLPPGVAAKVAPDRAVVAPAARDLRLFFLVVPVVQAVRYSVYDWSGLGELDGLRRARQLPRAFGDQAFRGAIEHNAILVALSLLLQLPLALGVALLLNRPLRGRACSD